MNKLLKNTVLAMALTFATTSVFAGAALAMDHGDHGDHGSHSSGHMSNSANDKSQISGHGGTASHMETRQIYTAGGTIESIDKAGKKATITHDPVLALGWPTMTMGFAFEDASLLDGLRVGDKVRFDFRNQGNASIIVDIETRE